MSTLEFTPPVHREGIIAKAEGPDGMVSSLSVLLKDANGRMFVLHVATEANYVAALNEFGGDAESIDDFPEPVFIVPAMTIDESLLDNIIGGTRPNLLGMYLVSQES